MSEIYSNIKISPSLTEAPWPTALQIKLYLYSYNLSQQQSPQSNFFNILYLPQKGSQQFLKTAYCLCCFLWPVYFFNSFQWEHCKCKKASSVTRRGIFSRRRDLKNIWLKKLWVKRIDIENAQQNHHSILICHIRPLQRHVDVRHIGTVNISDAVVTQYKQSNAASEIALSEQVLHLNVLCDH